VTALWTAGDAESPVVHLSLRGDVLGWQELGMFTFNYLCFAGVLPVRG
jgi:hypothetical protein